MLPTRLLLMESSAMVIVTPAKAQNLARRRARFAAKGNSKLGLTAKSIVALVISDRSRTNKS
jgi:hypothetical protein